MASMTMVATFPPPVELPTRPTSFYHSKNPPQDIHSPSWIPILPTTDPSRIEQLTSEKELSPFHHSSFSPLPTTSPSTPVLTQKLGHSPSKASLANEKTSNELEALAPRLPPIPVEKNVIVELPSTRPQSRYFERERKSLSPNADDDQNTTDTEVTGESSGRGSARITSIETASLLYSPHNPGFSKEDIDIASFPVAANTAAVAGRKSQNIPTSKYSRKPLPGSSRLTSAAPSIVHTPQPSPKISSAPPLSRQPSEYRLPLPASPKQTPTRPPTLPPNESTTPATSRKPSISNAVHAAKSTASQRRQRALNSHPSNISLKSRPNSSSDDSEAAGATPSVPPSRPSLHKPRKSTDSRTASRNGPLQNPTPAPTTPLPELPPHARTPNASVSSTPILPSTPAFSALEPMPRPLPSAHIPASSRPPPHVKIQAEHNHADMASFMTANSTVIFRRFDEVHVQLLLCLQDEITDLERELMKLDNARAEGQGERLGERGRVLRDLRRVVGEYDSLFQSWSQMQATKVSKATTNSLKAWLERPSTSAGAALGKEAKDDLEWLEKNGKDLSSVKLDGTEQGRRSENGVAGGGGGGLMSLLGSCGGKRK